MKLKFTASKLKKVIVMALLVGVTESVISYSSGPPSGLSNAPGDGNCTNCHSGSPITSGSTWSGITLTRAGGLSNVAPNSSNAMTLTFSSAISTRFGFELLVLPSSASSSSASVGTFTVGSSSDVQTVSATSPTRVYLEHTYAGSSASSGTKSWTFNWQTPVGFTGGATFYVAVNEADDDNSSAGDNIYVKTFSTTVLPVRWLDFTANENAGSVRLNWSTAQEINNNLFEVERSEDGKTFEKIGEVKGKGTTEAKSYYGFEDNAPLHTKALYRIKQLDMDGKEDYSKVISYDPAKNSEPQIVVNSTTQTIWFSNTDVIKQVKVWGLNGEVLQTYSQLNGANLQLNNLQNGMYLIEVTGTQGSQWMKKMLIQ
ncbi:MAG: hypothetical protein CFE21_11155 [Bacteroidetes bacterium B1(2017)]|nr:MAG: hypothetical protein CFE21_11155 [Bacteroidetes bacterium B1(2017)]